MEDFNCWRRAAALAGNVDELFFVGADRKLTVVAVKGSVEAKPGAKPSFEVGAPESLFEVHLAATAATNVYQYDVTADGKQLLVNTNNVGVSAPLGCALICWHALRKTWATG